jgi:hypothetical protein
MTLPGDTDLVREVEALEQLDEHVERDHQREPRLPLAEDRLRLDEIDPVDELEHEPELAVGLVQAEHARDVGVPQHPGDPRLVDEHLLERVVFALVGADELERERLARPRGVVDAEDLGHAAAGDLLDELVGPEPELAAREVEVAEAERRERRRRGRPLAADAAVQLVARVLGHVDLERR